MTEHPSEREEMIMWNLTVGAYETNGHILMNVSAYWQNDKDDHWRLRFEQRMKIETPLSIIALKDAEEVADAILCAVVVAWERESECTHINDPHCVMSSHHTYDTAGASQSVLPH